MDIATKSTGGQLTATEFNQIPDELEQIITDAGITKSAADLTQLSKSIANYVASGFFYVDSGVLNAYVLSAGGSRKGVTAFVDGMKIGFLVGATNTGASTVNINSLGVKAIRYTSGRAIDAGVLLVNDYVVIQYDSVNGYFILVENRFTRINSSGTRELPNDRLITAEYLKNTTNAYVHHLNETTWVNGGQAIGSEVLTQVGTIGTGTNHLGDTGVRGNFDGTTNAAYFNSSTFDTADESFFASLVVKPDRSIGTDEDFISKWDGVAANNSFFFKRDSTGALKFRIFYNSAGGAVDLLSNIDIDNILTDGKQHRAWCMYNQSNNSMMIGLDDTILGYKIDANLATRNNNSGTKLTIGAYDDVTLVNPFDGQMSDFTYHRTDYTGDDSRRIFASGASAIGKRGTEGLINGEVKIDGKQPVNINISPSTVSGLTNTAAADVSGWDNYAPENGNYIIRAHAFSAISDGSANGTVALFAGLYKNSASLFTINEVLGATVLPNGFSLRGDYTFNSNYQLEKDDILTLRALTGNVADTYSVASGTGFALTKDL